MRIGENNGQIVMTNLEQFKDLKIEEALHWVLNLHYEDHRFIESIIYQVKAFIAGYSQCIEDSGINQEEQTIAD